MYLVTILYAIAIMRIRELLSTGNLKRSSSARNCPPVSSAEFISKITLKIRIEVPKDQNAEDVKKALADSKQRCLISASMKTAVKIEAEIVNVQPPAQAS